MFLETLWLQKETKKIIRNLSMCLIHCLRCSVLVELGRLGLRWDFGGAFDFLRSPVFILVGFQVF